MVEIGLKKILKQFSKSRFFGEVPQKIQKSREGVGYLKPYPDWVDFVHFFGNGKQTYISY